MINSILIAVAYVIYILLSLALTLTLAWTVFEKFRYKTRCTGDIGEGFVRIAGIIIAAFLFFGLLLFLYTYFKIIMFILVALGLITVVTYYFLNARKGV